MNPATSRRLWSALALSVVLHLLIVFPLRFPSHKEADVRHIHLQAQIPPPQPAPPRITSAPANVDPTKQVRSPATSKNLHKAGPGPKAQAPAEAPKPAPEPEPPREALILDQALLPEYPAQALAQGLEACVLASVEINVAGEVESVQIIESDHPGIFDESVTAAQKAARYAPARRGNTVLASRVLTVATFVMTPGKQLDCPLKYATIAEKLTSGTAQ